ncbi:hypothetical protein J7I84_10765 [Arthrobacter sp. ISL-85]|uniref:hypothetical protein n=1 Tax=Arthrobacter sp. ISL-85 TaxID=2819115 RepID=UPI001BE8D620|nr:hypothetical protein [Arthrobacter sp. ISL-85]MBT2566966.1 hypothetical protein [Arthrobacter sp. ISL-85]
MTCRACGHDRDLELHSIAALSPPSTVMVEVGYACRACRRTYLHPADVAAVAEILNRESHADDVVTFAGSYFHCGQLMQKTGSELRRLSAPIFTDRTTEDDLDVYLTTQVLHCPCGFQIELPE